MFLIFVFKEHNIVGYGQQSLRVSTKSVRLLILVFYAPCWLFSYSQLYHERPLYMRWSITNEQEMVIINSYPKSANVIIVLVNSQPQFFLLNSKLFQVFKKFVNDADISVWPIRRDCMKRREKSEKRFAPCKLNERAS